MNIGLLGYGRMGHAIEAIAQQRGHTVVARIEDTGQAVSAKPDVWIDFSLPVAMAEYLPQILEMKKPVVIGTTGWADELANYTQQFEAAGVPGVFGSNFSVGVQLFFRSLAQTTALMDRFSAEYDVGLSEEHHNQKKDAPSGTALSAADIVLAHSQAKKTLLTELPQREIAPDELTIGVSRIGNIPGTHAAVWDSAVDSIELKHTARSRDGFALGAVLAAEKVAELPAGLHDFNIVFDQLFNLSTDA